MFTDFYNTATLSGSFKTAAKDAAVESMKSKRSNRWSLPSVELTTRLTTPVVAIIGLVTLGLIIGA